MTRLFFIIFFFIFLTSCGNRRDYKYVEEVQEENILGGTDTKEKEAKPIKAENDSSAYLQAYQKFCISQKVNKDMQQSLGKVYSSPIKFKLYNDKGEDITNKVFFVDKDKKEKEIEDRIFSMRNTIQESIDKNKSDEIQNFQKTVKVDSPKIRELEKYFRVKSDEFSNDDKKWYKPKSAPIYTNANGIYCYFQTENEMPGNLRFRLQYYSDDWLFFRKVQFSIDGKAFEYIPSTTETDSGDGGYVWEWFDEPVTESDMELIQALANAKSAKMKLVGKQYYDTKSLSSDQIKAIKRTIELYQALGGQF